MMTLIHLNRKQRSDSIVIDRIETIVDVCWSMAVRQLVFNAIIWDIISCDNVDDRVNEKYTPESCERKTLYTYFER